MLARVSRPQRKHSVEEAGRVSGEEEILGGKGPSRELPFIEHLLVTLRALLP